MKQQHSQLSILWNWNSGGLDMSIVFAAGSSRAARSATGLLSE